MLHYDKKMNGEYRSIITDSHFFLSKNGAVSPSEELDSTIISFFNNDLKDDEHPVCKYPARFSWLKKELEIDSKKLPYITCPKYNEVKKNINPQSATLIFPSAYMNSPSSMLGHTLIRINGDAGDLLSYAINYSAKATDKNIFISAYRGLFGNYRGSFSILPYYQKLKEYNDLEYRDIWEYELNLAKEETEHIIDHIWELKDIRSDYFFLDENCSFNLLYLLDVARPSARLIQRYWDRSHLWVDSFRHGISC